MSSPCSPDWEAWLATAWNPLLSEPKLRKLRSFVNPYHVAARPLDPRHLPFAIVKNTQMIPALLQNFRDYCESPSAYQDFTRDHTIFEQIEVKKNVLAILGSNGGDDEFWLEFNFPRIVLKLLHLLGQQRVNYTLGHTIEPVGVQVTGEWYRCADDDDGTDYDDPKPSATVLCLFHWLSLSNNLKDDAFYVEIADWEAEEVADMVDTMIDNISQMADKKHVFDHVNRPHVLKENSLVIRVRFGESIGVYSTSS
jgi:hypothetical protein